MRYTIYTRDDDFSRELASKFNEVLTDEFHDTRDDDSPQIVLCIGGDGTILRAIHQYESQLDKLCFVGIHTGTLGFFTDYTKEDFREFLHDLHHNKPVIQSYPLIEAIVDDEQTYRALNEIRLGSFTTTVYYDISIDGEYFETVCSAGICVSTEAGSTAANRAVGGAVVDDGLNILELTQIMPVSHINQHSMTSPYILKQERVIEITGESLDHSLLCYDHKETKRLKQAKKVVIKLSDQKVLFARFRPYSYLERLKNLF